MICDGTSVDGSHDVVVDDGIIHDMLVMIMMMPI